MPGDGFFEQKRSSPTSLIVVVAVHAAAIAALALAKIEIPDIGLRGPLTVRNIPLTPDPPPIPPEPVTDRVEPQHRSVISPPKREVVTVTKPNQDYVYREPADIVWTDTRVGELDRPRVEPLPPPPPQPVPEPVRIEAKLKPGIELLPPYPAAEERAQAEGSVTVKLLIGPDGRVKAAEKVRAASEAFWRATERHAVRAWRFTPATVDGRPVESRKVVTVKFELRG